MRAGLFLIVLFLFALPFTAVYGAEKERFALYYSDKIPVEKFEPYELLIFDSNHHPALRPLKEEGKTLLGYVSLGEIGDSNPAYALLKSRGLILQENKNWKGRFFIDLRDPLWAKMVLEDIVPGILRQGFDGVFLDTLDDAIELERQDPSKYRGMTESAVHLVQAIRMQYPTVQIMMNRAYGILPATVNAIDMELGESVYADYDFDKKSYRKVSAENYHDQVKWLQKAKEHNAHLKVYTLDYSNARDESTIGEIYRTERANGFIPYVSTIELDRLIEEPESP